MAAPDAASRATARDGRPLSKVLGEMAPSLDPRATLALKYYLRTARNALEQARVYRAEGDAPKQLYVLLLRAVSLVVETIPAHAKFGAKENAALLQTEYKRLRAQAVQVMAEIEALRPKIDAIGENELKARRERERRGAEARAKEESARRAAAESERRERARAQVLMARAAEAASADAAGDGRAGEDAQPLPWDGLALDDGFEMPAAVRQTDGPAEASAGDFASQPATLGDSGGTDLLSASPQAVAAAAAANAAARSPAARGAPGARGAQRRAAGAHSVLGSSLSRPAAQPASAAVVGVGAGVRARPAAYPLAQIDSRPTVLPSETSFRPARRRSPPPAQPSPSQRPQAKQQQQLPPPDWGRAFPPPQQETNGKASPAAPSQPRPPQPQQQPQESLEVLPPQQPYTPAQAQRAQELAAPPAAPAPEFMALPPQPVEVLQPTPAVPGQVGCCAPGQGAMVPAPQPQLQEAAKAPGWAVTNGDGVEARSDGPRAVHFSPHVLREFMRLAARNTRRGIETCAVLAGKMSQGAFFVTLMVVPKQEGTQNSCNTLNEEEIFEVQDKHELFSLGWIHTHPTQTCFMSSIDVHTHCAYQTMLPEAIAVVMAPTDPKRKCGVFQLTEPDGLKAIQRCPHRGFHTHPPLPSGRPLYDDAVHVMLDERVKFSCMDLR